MELTTLLVSAGLLLTLVALVAGLMSMAQGGEYDKQHSTQLMLARVGSQGITFFLLLVALYLMNN